MRPSLQQLCGIMIAANILDYRDGLPLLPLDLQVFVANTILGKKPKPYLYELEILCEVLWKPSRLCLSGIPCLNVRGLNELSFVNSLIKLDLSGCGSWLDSLSFLPGRASGMLTNNSMLKGNLFIH
eukprot:Gb_04329 [translate_table: standard]